MPDDDDEDHSVGNKQKTTQPNKRGRSRRGRARGLDAHRNGQSHQDLNVRSSSNSGYQAADNNHSGGYDQSRNGQGYNPSYNQGYYGGNQRGGHALNDGYHGGYTQHGGYAQGSGQNGSYRQNRNYDQNGDYAERGGYGRSYSGYNHNGDYDQGRESKFNEVSNLGNRVKSNNGRRENGDRESNSHQKRGQEPSGNKSSEGRDYYRTARGRPNGSSSQSYRREPDSQSNSQRNEDSTDSGHNYPRYPTKSKNQGKRNTAVKGSSENSAASSTEPKTSDTKQLNRKAATSKVLKEVRVGDSHASTLKYQIQDNTYECMVCYDALGPYCAIYNCDKCFNIFHLNCIRQWAISKQDVEPDQGPSKTWTCPACQTKSEEIPARYFCFCKSVINPKFHPYTLPHSCGEKCTRKREECSHGCTDLCHPGKCIPCAAFVNISCPCGGSSNRVKCNKKDTVVQCAKVCDKMLSCGLHNCQTVCHAGPCSPCEVLNKLSCYCGESVSSINCGGESPSTTDEHTGYWACHSPCSRDLSCKNHECPKVCHPGPCKPCPTDAVVVSTCPCEKTKLEKLSPTPRSSCLEDIPTCKKQCKKVLPCGDQERDHFCQYLCHMGNCPPCSDASLIMCNCSSTSEKLKCAEVQEDGLQCERVCNKKKSCGRHRCNDKCCNEGAHICMLDCGKLLSCRVHKCAELCHKGHCMPCLMSNFSEMTCHCGKTIVEPPIPCGTLPPNCKEPCIRQHDCEHVVQHVCHNNEFCPLCPFLVNKMCMGNHAVRFNVPCHLTDVSCGERCQKLLPCSLHSCSQWCHKGDCWPAGKICDLPCQNTRTECSHICGENCHPGFLCPQTVCGMKAIASCECGRRTVDVICYKGGSKSGSKSPKMDEVIAKFKKMKFSTSQSDISYYLSAGKIMCDEDCRAQERNKALAEGLGLVDVPIDSLLVPQYSEYLKLESKINSAFILQLEREFATVIGKYKLANSKADHLNAVKFMYHNFPPMNKEKRRTIHELAAIYKIESESHDPEPQRNVVAKCCWRSEIPNIILSQYHKKRLVDGAKCVPKPLSNSDRIFGDSAPNLQTLKMPDVSEASQSTSTPSQLLMSDSMVLDDWEQASP